MKLIVFSDSHGHSGPMRRAAELHPDADLFLHLGDGNRDFERLCDDHSLPHEAVRGNCDLGAYDVPTTRLLDLSGCRILLTHGHEYGVKYTLTDLIRAGRAQNADLILFGHTHIPLCSYHAEDGQRGIHLLNPGSIGYNSSYGIVRIGRTVRDPDGGTHPEILTSTTRIE